MTSNAIQLMSLHLDVIDCGNYVSLVGDEDEELVAQGQLPLPTGQKQLSEDGYENAASTMLPREAPQRKSSR